jgi:uncharacterized protein YndB with AHSA1/START domain
MTQTQTSNTKTAKAPEANIATGKIVVKRTIPATADELFEAWLDADSIAQWMLPGDHRPNTVSLDARVGGVYEIIMHHQNGDKRHYGEYRSIDRNKKLVFTWHSDATHHLETLVTVEFIAATDHTEVVLTHERIPDHEAALGHTRGWTLGLELLEKFLKH